MRQLHGSYRKAFTLIEIMVVMTIISILAATVFPVFAQASKQAKQTACMSNSRQLGMAIVMYASDYDDRLPIATYSGQSPASHFNLYYCQFSHLCGYRWSDELLPYVKSIGLFACPSDTTSFSWDNKALNKLSYGVNAYAYGPQLDSSWDGAGPSLDAIPTPASRIFLTEVGARLESVALWCFRAPQLNHDPDHNACRDKHGRYVAIYFDGHAKMSRLHGLPDPPYTPDAPPNCSQTPTCMEKAYPEWAAWLP